jgi:mannose-6-phosphate isomerase-like protein (cupin superfamily)
MYGEVHMNPGAIKNPDSTVDGPLFLTVLHSQPGAVHVSCDHYEVTCGPGDVVLIPPRTSYTVANLSSTAKAAFTFCLVTYMARVPVASHADDVSDKDDEDEESPPPPSKRRKSSGRRR